MSEVNSNLLKKYGEYKVCTKCKENIHISKFGIANSKRSQLRGDCKDCRKKVSTTWYNNNKESRLKSIQKWKNDNIEKVTEYNKIWVNNNRDKVRSTQKKYYYSNMDKMSIKRISRRAAVPSWLSDEMKKDIKIIYDACRMISNIECEKYHVDHIIPIKGENVSGLHVPWNLQIITAKENLSKSNKFKQEGIKLAKQ